MYLWILLAIGLAVAISISFMHDPKFLGMEVKQGTFKDVILAEELGEEAADALEVNLAHAADSSSGETSAGMPGSAATEADNSQGSETVASAGEQSVSHGDGPTYHPDPNIKSVLIFGDSMTILVANRLAQYGAKNGYRVTSITWDSSTTEKWSKCDTLDHFIERYKPDFIMITLGSNELFLRDFATRKPYVQKLIAKMGNIPFVWISPPNWKQDRGFNTFMTQVLPRGTFFNSNGLELPRQKDNIHPTMEGGATWTDSIMNWLKRTPHPLAAEMPDPGTPTKHNMHYYKANHR